MPDEQLDFRVLKIAGAFSEGNTRRTWAINEVTQASSKKMAALLAAKVMKHLLPDVQNDFVRALYNRVKS